MDIRIREMIKEDWERVSKIYADGIKTNLATFTTEVPMYKEWDESHLDNFRYVAIVNHKVVGWCALSPVSSRCVYSGVAEVSVYVDPTFEGKGIGTLLVSHLIKSTTVSSIWTLQAHIMENNTASLQLHEKCGFRIVGMRERFGCDMHGEWRNVLLLERRKKD